jgi:hypothetical protein
LVMAGRWDKANILGCCWRVCRDIRYGDYYVCSSRGSNLAFYLNMKSKQGIKLGLLVSLFTNTK